MDPFRILIRYFDALVMVLGLWGAWVLRKKLRSLVAEEPSLEAGARTLLRTVVILVTLVPFLNGSLRHLGGGGSDPGWWATGDPRNPYLLAHFAFHCLFVLVALWWAWFADGPMRLLKYRAVFADAGMNPFDLSPAGLKWFITLVSVGFTLMRVVLLFGERRH